MGTGPNHRSKQASIGFTWANCRRAAASWYASGQKSSVSVPLSPWYVSLKCV
jgi:hypothetical protein